MSKQANVELESWSEFATPNLEIAPDLLGQSHVFTFEEREIAIRLPTAESLPEYDSGRYVKGERLSVNTWNLQTGTPLWVIVHDADVVISIPDRHSIPEEARSGILLHREFYSEEQAQRLGKLATHYGDLAYRGFDLWIRTLRWKADDYRIGTPGLSGMKVTGSQNEIWEKDAPNRIWEGGLHITLFTGKPVTVEVWDKVSEALNAGESPPISYELLYSAMAHYERGDLQRTVVEAAVAAETFMRINVQAGLPNGLDDPLKEYINRAHISRVKDNFFPKRLDTQQRKTYKSLRPDLKKLFDYRNAIMHSGQKEGLTAPHCQKIVNSVHELISLEPIKAT